MLIRRIAPIKANHNFTCAIHKTAKRFREVILANWTRRIKLLFALRRTNLVLVLTGTYASFEVCWVNWREQVGGPSWN